MFRVCLFAVSLRARALVESGAVVSKCKGVHRGRRREGRGKKRVIKRGRRGRRRNSEKKRETWAFFTIRKETLSRGREERSKSDKGENGSADG